MIVGAGADVPDRSIKPVIFKNYASLTDCISKINNTQIDNAIE